jgi:hypothetical protein
MSDWKFCGAAQVYPPIFDAHRVDDRFAGSVNHPHEELAHA